MAPVPDAVATAMPVARRDVDASLVDAAVRSGDASASPAPGATFDPLALGAVVKYSPEQPRDENGRWTRMRGMLVTTGKGDAEVTFDDVVSAFEGGHPGRFWTQDRGVAEEYSVAGRIEAPGWQSVIVHGTSRKFDRYVVDEIDPSADVVDVERIEVWDRGAGAWRVLDRPVRKHGSHDQKSHGNWARGGHASDLKGDFNPRSGEPIKTTLEDYLTVDNVDFDTVAAVRDAFEGEWGGLRAQVTGIYGTADGGNVHVVGIVLDEDDEQMGEFIRDIFPETREVSHQSLFLSNQVQGRGFAKGFLTQSEAHYRAQGMKSVLVMASDAVGGYAWAKAGFDFLDGYPPTHVREAMERFVSQYGDHRLAPKVTRWLNGDDEWPSAYEIATLGEGSDDFEYDQWDGGTRKVHAGAEIMLGTEWAGIKHLDRVRKHVHLDDLSDEDWEWIERACADMHTVRKHGGASHDQSSHGNRGGRVRYGRKPRWSPTMTRDDAEHWAKDSKIQDVLTHTTSRGNLSEPSEEQIREAMDTWGLDFVAGRQLVMSSDLTAENGILREGFKPGGSGVFGNGIYLGLEDLVEEQEYPDGWNKDDWLNDKLDLDGTVRSFPGMVQALHDAQADAYAYNSSKESTPTLRVKVDVRKPFVVNVPGVDIREPSWYVHEALRQRHPERVTETIGLDLSTILPRFGYDALVIRHPGEFDWNVGGDQVVIWDPKKATVIVDDEGNPESYRYRKMRALDPFELVAKYSPSQPRDERGRWTDTGSSSSSFLLDTREGRDRWESMTLNEQIAYATSDANPYKTGKVVGGDMRSGDFRVEVDPRRRFTELWQRTYEGYGAVRTAAQAVLDGDEDILADVDLFDDVPFPKTWNGDPGDRTWKYDEEDYAQDVASAGLFVAEGLRNAKPGERLFRGTTMSSTVLQDWQTGYKTNRRFTLGPTSTSSDRDVAGRYAQSASGAMRTTFIFDGSTKRFDLTHSDWANDHPESIIAGEFEVLHVNFDEHGATVLVKPVSQP